MKICIVLLGICSCMWPVIESFPSGPPSSACQTMRPSHPGGTFSNLGYQLFSLPLFRPGEDVIVTIFNVADYRGIFLQVRDGQDMATSSAVGSWSMAVSPDLQIIDCSSVGFPPNSALGHTNRNEKPAINSIIWTAPSDCVDGQNYYIRMTVVQSLTQIQEPAEHIITCDNPPPQPPTTTQSPATQPPSTQPSTTQTSTTQPSTTQPPPTQPPTTQPPPTQPPTTQPPPTQPSTTQPPPTQPSTTQPPPTQPSTTQPPFTQPSTTQPPVTQSSTSETPATVPVELTPPPDSCVFSSFNSVPQAYSNDFEEQTNNLRGWDGSGSGTYAWTRITGPTPSQHTGPDSAYEGNAYIYVEASTPAQPGQIATLQTQADLRGCFCFTFAYSFNANLAGLNSNHTLAIDVAGRRIFFADEYSPSWIVQSITVDTPNFVQIQITAIRGKDWVGDIALDNFRLTPGAC